MAPRPPPLASNSSAEEEEEGSLAAGEEEEVVSGEGESSSSGRKNVKRRREGETPPPPPPPKKKRKKKKKKKRNYNASATTTHDARSSCSLKKKKKPNAKRPKTRSSTTPDDDDDDIDADADADGGRGGVVVAVKTKKKLFERIWSEEDEIGLLNGMIEYSAKTGTTDPANLDMNAFHDFIRNSLHVDEISKAQLVDKIRRLRKKYRNNADRGRKRPDQAPIFSKPHEHKAFQLSKKIWGGGDRPDPTPLPPVLLHHDEFQRYLRAAGVGLLSPPPAAAAAAGWSLDHLTGESKIKRTQLEEEWKKLHVAELELFLKRTDLIKDHTNFILHHAYNSSSSHNNL